MKRWLEPASADLAAQVRVIRALVDEVQEKEREEALLSQRQKDSPPESTAPSGGGLQRRFYNQNDLDAQLKQVKSRNAEKEIVALALKRAKELGPIRRVAGPPDTDALAAIATDFPNFGSVVKFVSERATLARLVPDSPFKLPPVLLVGPPGTGKTAFSRRLASVLGVPMMDIDITTLDTHFKVTGLDSGYSSAKPGLIWDALENECISPVILLDELEKQPNGTKDHGLGFLLGLFEPVSARSYQDACVRLAVDASWIFWVGTCNDVDALDAPLRSRLRVIHIDAPDPAQMRSVARSVYRGMRENESWAQVFEQELREEVVDALVERTPRELRLALEDGAARAAGQGRTYLLPEDLPPVLEEETQSRPMGFLGQWDVSVSNRRR